MLLQMPCSHWARTHAVEAFLLSIASAQGAQHKHVCSAVLERTPVQKVVSCWHTAELPGSFWTTSIGSGVL